jgi:hypothetical protein
MAIQRFPYLYQQAREENVSDGRGPFAGARDRCRFPSPGGETRYAWFDWWVSRAEQPRPVSAATIANGFLGRTRASGACMVSSVLRLRRSRPFASQL